MSGGSELTRNGSLLAIALIMGAVLSACVAFALALCAPNAPAMTRVYGYNDWPVPVPSNWSEHPSSSSSFESMGFESCLYQVVQYQTKDGV